MAVAESIVILAVKISVCPTLPAKDFSMLTGFCLDKINGDC